MFTDRTSTQTLLTRFTEMQRDNTLRNAITDALIEAFITFLEMLEKFLAWLDVTD